MTTIKTIAMLAVPGVQLLDVSGPLDVFAEANVQSDKPAYRLLLVGVANEPILSSSGVRLMPDRAIGGRLTDRIDTLLVAGAPNAADRSPSTEICAWLRASVASARRYGSVCSGAFLLAAAGLLENRRVATHWAVADRLAAVARQSG